MANCETLKAYINEHHRLPPKNAPLGAKRVRGTVLLALMTLEKVI